ncbi:putative helicase [Phycisphaera mikurensis NBRC 102666]|uniref:Putative helicase n=1 Tax=Phycisphaera mikurensis (strain NBRC 102666 / KCTC 22515 / FYK2301M01) TaxID=1142394 RepID=I0IF61_PHYMF|nr:putative helicase [Phycisphaera mikurensis NBRC 102666]
MRIQGRQAQVKKQVQRQDRGEYLLRAVVTDGDQKHEVTISPDGKHAVAECDCDVFEAGQFCTHIWAALLDLNHDPPEDPEEPRIRNLSKLRLRAPKARKRDRGEVRTENVSGFGEGQESAWQSRMSMLRPDGETSRPGPLAALAAMQRQVCYVIPPRASARARGLVIELTERTASATGWSKPKPLKLGSDNLDELAHPVDRELGGLLLGATRVVEDDLRQVRIPSATPAQSTFRLAGGAQRSLLRRMIETGRCFVDLNEGGDVPRLRLLRWDEAQRGDTAGAANGEAVAGSSAAWVPWLTGRPGDGELRLDLQLRRAGRRVPVTAPLLALGGPDGVVIFKNHPDLGKDKQAVPGPGLNVAWAAPLDDHEASAWIQQFRDPRYQEEAEVEGRKNDVRGGMRIPDDEVQRFIERLYLLPQLPELDLPDGLGHLEQRVDPRPFLELFSPGTVQAQELGASGKTTLAARIYFDYGGLRVSPGRPGRFVPVAADATTTAPPDTAAPDGGGDGPNDAGADRDEAADTAALAEAGDESQRRLIRRNFRLEREAIEQTAGLGLSRPAAGEDDALVIASKHIPHLVSVLLARGWGITADQKMMRAGGPPALTITSGIDWFELRGSVTYQHQDGTKQEVSLPEILEAVRQGRSMIELDDGTQGLLPENWLAEHGLLTNMGEAHEDHLRFKASQAALLDTLVGDDELEAYDDTFALAREQVKSFDGIHPAEPTENFTGELRAYQATGLGWFNFLRQFGMGGVLADDMGLGKTVQVLAMLAGRKLELEREADALRGEGKAAGSKKGSAKAKRVGKPSLIVAPRSVIFNWLDEAEKFTPGLKVLAYSGPDRAKSRKKLADYDLIVTSFGLMRRDAEELQHVEFDYIVLDEAQAIKNPSSQSAKAARTLKADHRLALTGTPVENHLGDLWSIFEYLNPGMLGSNARFADLVRGVSGSIDAGGDGSTGSTAGALTGAQAAAADSAAEEGTLQDESATDLQQKSPDGKTPLQQLASALRPFILRRTKKQVLTDLPPKTEQTILCEMDPAQRKVYDDLRNYYRGSLMSQLDADGSTSSRKGLGKNAFMVLEALLRLRQAACHPALIKKEGIDTDAPSAKLDRLMKMLGDIQAEGGKALIFSQFTSMLHLVQERLDSADVSYTYLDGQTRNRRQVVDDFQTDPDLTAFLISLKAGGTGLNLTSAEYVFILDPWWNPAVEAQAIDRAHRIGQEKPVFAYRMICEDTVEQRILELQKRKRDLAEAVVGGEENLLSKLTRGDLEQLLS